MDVVHKVKVDVLVLSLKSLSDCGNSSYSYFGSVDIFLTMMLKEYTVKFFV